MARTSVAVDPRRLAQEIVALTDAFCAAHLDDEYRDLCRRLVATLARKRKPLFLRGEPRVWAAAVVHVAGWVNFLHDPTQTPHMTPAQFFERAGASKAAVEPKSRQVRELLDLVQFEPEWTRPSQMVNNPLAWLIMVDGFLVDARTLPPEVQAELGRMGLVPVVAR